MKCVRVVASRWVVWHPHGVATEEEQRLERAARAYRRAEKTLSDRRGELHEAVTAAVSAGMSKSEAARRTGYTREYVTTLVSTKS